MIKDIRDMGANVLTVKVFWNMGGNGDNMGKTVSSGIQTSNPSDRRGSESVDPVVDRS